MLDLSQLELLCAVGRTGSYSGAARELQLTQPAVTYQMQRLEKSLGTQLAVRVGRTMRLTSIGALVRDQAERVLSEARAAELRIGTAIGTSTATVRLSAFPSTCATLVPRTLARLRQSHPNLRVLVSQDESHTAHERALSGEVDIALTYVYGPRDGAPHREASADRLDRLRIGIDDTRLLLPLDHPLADREVLQPGDLLEDTFLLGSQYFREMLTGLCAPLGKAPPMLVVPDDYVAMQAWVAFGHGVALLPELPLRAHQNEHLVVRTLAGTPSRHILIETWPDQSGVHAVATVIGALRAAFAALPPRPAT